MSELTPKLTRRIATVELADGRILTARITNPDLIRFEDAAQLNGWPGPTIKNGVATLQGTERQNTYTAWAALKREGKYQGNYDAFELGDCLEVNVEEVVVDPTQPAPASVSVPSSLGSDVAPLPSSEMPTTS